MAREVQRLQLLQEDVKVDRRHLEKAAGQSRAEIAKELQECLTKAADSFKALGERWADAMIASERRAR